MPFKFIREEPRHFVAHNGRQEIRIAKAGISPSNRTRYRAMCKGGTVKKMAEGGEVTPESGVPPLLTALPPVQQLGATGMPLGPARAPNTGYPGNVRAAKPGEGGAIDWELAADRAPHLIGNAVKKEVLDPLAGAVQGLAGMDYSNAYDPLVAGVRSVTRGTKYADEKARLGQAWDRPGNVEKDPRQDPEAYDKFAMHLFNAGMGTAGGRPGQAGAGLFGRVAGETPTFYSAAERAIQGAQRKQGNAQAWLSEFAKAGVKREELEQTGLAKFLSDTEFTRNLVSQKAERAPAGMGVSERPYPTEAPAAPVAPSPRTISRDEIAAYLAKNKIEPSVTAQGAMVPHPEAEKRQDALRAIQDRIDEYKRIAADPASPDRARMDAAAQAQTLSGVRKNVEMGDAHEMWTVNGSFYQHTKAEEPAMQAVKIARERMAPYGPPNPAQIHMDAVEILQGLIERYRTAQGDSSEKAAKLYGDAIPLVAKFAGSDLGFGKLESGLSRNGQYEQITLGGHRPGSYHEIFFHANQDGKRIGTSGGSHHFGQTNDVQPGLVAHARATEHLDSTGKPMLMVEEIQSDLHQHGRTEGYLTPEVHERLKRENMEAAGALTDFKLKMAKKYGGDFQRRSYDGEHPMSMAEDRKWEQLTEAYRVAEKAWNDVYKMTPDIPWKDNAHETLVAKQLLRHAADQGYGKLAWTTGEQQSRHYDLRKHVDRLEYHPESHVLDGYKNGESVASHKIPPGELDKFLPKEAVDHIRDRMSTRTTAIPGGAGPIVLQGVDFKIGGKGMIAAYDQRLPAIFQKLVKKYGGTVQQETTGGNPIPKGISQDAEALATILRRDGYRVNAQQLLERPQSIDPGALGHISGHANRAYLGAYDRLYSFWEQHHEKGMKVKPQHTVWTVTIPEAAKKAMLKEGFSSFAKGGKVKPMHLAHEDERTLHVSRPDGTTVIFAKGAIDPHLLQRLRNLPRLDQEQILAGDQPVQHFQEGGAVQSIPPMNPQQLLYTPGQPALSQPIMPGPMSVQPLPFGVPVDPALPPPQSPEAQRAALDASYAPGAPNPLAGMTPPGMRDLPPPPTAPGLPYQPGTSDYESGAYSPPSAGKGLGDLLMAIPNAMQRNYEQLPGVQPGGPAGSYNPPPGPTSPLQSTIEPGPMSVQPPPEAPRPAAPPTMDQSFPPLPVVPSLGDPGESTRNLDFATGMYSQALAAKAQAEQGVFKALADQATRTKESLDAQIKSTQDYVKAREAGGQQLFQEIMNQQIDPRHFFELKDEKGNGTGKEDTWLKVKAGIGMLFSGIGSGLTGAPNLAYQIIDKAIERDIDAQKANLAKKQNAYSYYLAQTHQDLSARQLLKADLLTVAAAEAASLENQGKAAIAGPAGMAASAQFMANAAAARSNVLQQEMSRAVQQFQLNYSYYQQSLLRTALSWQPGQRSKVEGPDKSEFIRKATAIGLPGFEGDKIATEPIDFPMRVQGKDGRPIDATYKDEYGTTRTKQQTDQRAYVYHSKEEAQEANKELGKNYRLMQIIRSMKEAIKANPEGFVADLAWGARGRFGPELLTLKSMYESEEAGVKRQPNSQVIELLDNALKNPGGFLSSQTGSALAALDGFESILENHSQTFRAKAKF